MRILSLKLHPLYFAVLPVVFLYAHNKEELPLQVVGYPLVVLGLSALALTGLAFLFTRNFSKASLVPQS